jgi:hypothetical protein
MTPYIAATSVEKAKALRLEAAGRVRIIRELDTRVLRVGRGVRLVAREIFNVEPLESAT